MIRYKYGGVPLEPKGGRKMVALSSAAADKLAGHIVIFFVLIPAVIGLILCVVRGRRKISPEQMNLDVADWRLKQERKKQAR